MKERRERERDIYIFEDILMGEDGGEFVLGGDYRVEEAGEYCDFATWKTERVNL